MDESINKDKQAWKSLVQQAKHNLFLEKNTNMSEFEKKERFQEWAEKLDSLGDVLNKETRPFRGINTEQKYWDYFEKHYADFTKPFDAPGFIGFVEIDDFGVCRRAFE